MRTGCKSQYLSSSAANILLRVAKKKSLRARTIVCDGRSAGGACPNFCERSSVKRGKWLVVSTVIRVIVVAVSGGDRVSRPMGHVSLEIRLKKYCDSHARIRMFLQGDDAEI